MDSRLDQIFFKIGRASHHLENLQIAIRAFLDSDPYTVTAQRNQHTKDFEWVLTSARDIPAEISLIAGDVIHNLRSALDHLAWHLVKANKGNPTTLTCFPISKSASEHASKRTQERIAGMRPEAIAAINALKPYDGGNVALWRIHSLNNRDKHRVLIAAAHALAHHDILPGQREHLTRMFLESHPGATPPNLTGMNIRPDNASFPMEVGKVFFSIPESKMENDFKFQLDIAFNEPGLVQGETVLNTVQYFYGTVRHVVSSFEPFLR